MVTFPYFLTLLNFLLHSVIVAIFTPLLLAFYSIFEHFWAFLSIFEHFSVYSYQKSMECTILTNENYSHADSIFQPIHAESHRGPHKGQQRTFIEVIAAMFMLKQYHATFHFLDITVFSELEGPTSFYDRIFGECCIGTKSSDAFYSQFLQSDQTAHFHITRVKWLRLWRWLVFTLFDADTFFI